MNQTRNFILTVASLVTLVAGAHPVPQHGRFLQRDPNASGQVVLNNEAWFDGTVPLIEPSMVVMQEIYANGFNLYTTLGNNPVMRTDPLGLSWDPFDWVEGIIFEHEMSKQLAFAQLNSRISDPEMLQKLRLYERGMMDFMMDFVWDRDVGALFSMIGGPFFARACFEEGTLVWTVDGLQPIEALSLGDEVMSHPDPELEPGEALELPVEPGSLALVRLRYGHADGAQTVIETLRPTSLVDVQEITFGQSVPITVLELGIAGEAEVLAVAPFSKPVRTDVPVVATRFFTDRAIVVDLFLEGEERPIGVTPNHPVFSLDRGTWVEAGSLAIGERLASANRAGNGADAEDDAGVTVVARVEPREKRVAVYNLEVSRYHTYFVGEQGVWVHNGCHLSPQVRPRPGFRGLKGGPPRPAVRVGQDVYVAVSHAHARDMARGGDGLEPYFGRVTGALNGYVEFLDDLGTQWKWLDK